LDKEEKIKKTPIGREAAVPFRDSRFFLSIKNARSNIREIVKTV